MFCVLFCILLIISGNVTRFLVTVVPFLCILAALGFAGIASVRWRAVPAYILLVVLLLHNLLAFHRILSTSDPYSPVMLGERREEYLERTITSARAIDRCVNGLGRETRVLFLGETRGYYCSNPAVVPTAFDRNPLITWANEAADYSSLAERLREARITHVLENEAEFQRLGMGKQLTARGLENWRNLKLQGARTIYSDPNCHVYEINI
jgi:sugar phosphate isomerase/epimerase